MTTRKMAQPQDLRHIHREHFVYAGLRQIEKGILDGGREVAEHVRPEEVQHRPAHGKDEGDDDEREVRLYESDEPEHRLFEIFGLFGDARPGAVRPAAGRAPLSVFTHARSPPIEFFSSSSESCE